MAATVLENAVEKSTYIVTVAFTDEDGDALTPAAITWTLTDVSGAVINSRSDVVVTVPAASINIVLSGLDLAIISGVTNKRVLTVEATYNSSYGTGLPLNARAEFTIEPLVAVS